MRSSDSKAASLAARLFGGNLPPEVMLDVRRRLRIASLACFGAFLCVLVSHLWLVHIGWSKYHNVHVRAMLIGMTVSLALFALFGYRRIPESALINVGFAAEWLLCSALSNMELRGPDPRPAETFGVSLACIALVLAPILIPAPPWKVLVFSLVCAATGPMAYTHLLFERHASATFRDYFNLYAVNVVAAFLALAPAFVLWRLRAALEEAREFGNYKLLERLGQGGMGEVWSARHRLLARPAAIKLIGSQFSDPVLTKRFEHEVQATAALRNPHTITVYDYGVADDGTFYYVMELLEGMDLAAMVNELGPLPPARAVFLLAQVLESLEEAHAAGLVHRDIKPENVYVCRLGLRGDFVKVLDFGLALSVTVPADARLTSANAVQGTPAYMAPEQAIEQPVDARTDLYSVACLGYWLLTARTVFDGSNAVEHIVHHVGTPAPRVSQRSEFPLSGDLEELLLRCLDKDPAKRPADAATLRRSLLACRLDGAWTQDEADTWWTERKARTTPDSV